MNLFFCLSVDCVHVQELTPEQIQDIRQVFNDCDHDRDGKIYKNELNELMKVFRLFTSSFSTCAHAENSHLSLFSVIAVELHCVDNG